VQLWGVKAHDQEQNRSTRRSGQVKCVPATVHAFGAALPSERYLYAPWGPSPDYPRHVLSHGILTCALSLGSDPALLVGLVQRLQAFRSTEAWA
jgi:hypothetical protein